jgi:hypothetical protein
MNGLIIGVPGLAVQRTHWKSIVRPGCRERTAVKWK